MTTMPGGYYPPANNYSPYPIQSSMAHSTLPPAHYQAQAVQHGGLQTVSITKDGRKYTLEVVQQPRRARMCGFGDKDRRPITPPPCIRLRITNVQDGHEVDPNEIVDCATFTLVVDLWDERAASEVNLVRHSSSTPAVSISAATPCPYPPPPERPYLGLMNPGQMAAYGYGSQPIGYPQQYDPYMQQHAGAAMAPPYIQASQNPVSGLVPNHSQGMYTRNLIGSTTVPAAKLQDDKNQTGLWFVLQDLSVRTEGIFRLHMRFFDVADANEENGLNKNHAPCLSSAFSDTFQVYSAKKFPGVVESTALSRAFANQGIKIPIRKDASKIPNQSEYDADDQ